MTTKGFTVWMQIEEIDVENDLWENVGEPDSLGTFNTLEEAKEHARDVYDKMSKEPHGCLQRRLK